MSANKNTPVPQLPKAKAAAPTKNPPVIRGSTKPKTDVQIVEPSKVKTRTPLPAEKTETK